MEQRFTLWHPILLISSIAILMGFGLTAIGFPQWGGALAGGAAFIMAAGAAQRYGPGLTRGDRPPQIVDPEREPPMRRGA